MKIQAVSARGVEPVPTLFGMVRALWSKLDSNRRRQFFVLLALMCLASIAEVCSVAAVLPFLGVLTAPARVLAYPALQPVFRLLAIENAQQLLLPVTVVFCGAALFAGAIRLLLLYATAHYSYALGADLSIDVYRRTLYQPYAVHIARNSSEVINGIINKTGLVIGSILVPLLTLFSAALLLTTLLIGLLALDPVIALGAGLVCGSIYWMILRLTRQSLRRNSESIASESDQVVKLLQEGLGGIRDVLLDGTQEIYCRVYRQADHAVRRAQGYNTFISASPRYMIETLGMVVIAVVAYVISQREGGVIAAIPVLGTLALGAQRMLPVLQQAYSSFVMIRTAEASLRDVLHLMDQSIPDDAHTKVTPIAFEREIALRNIGFRYSEDSMQVLRNVDLEIRKGQRIGFVGTTGSGKSTLLDIVMGLLAPTEGTLAIDGRVIGAGNRRAWQTHVAHVPQSIYLADTTIEENIAFGVRSEDIDMDRVRSAARQAQIADVIESLPKKYQTFVGERGVRLSGGQRQRIGIARALYKQANVIIFDEATSALDDGTERALMEAVDALGRDLTILIIAHRLTTLKGCDLIVEIDAGCLRRVGNHDELIVKAV